jgi:hypothetical protein
VTQQELFPRTDSVLVYTSNFASAKKLRQAGIEPVGIAIRPPHWYVGRHYLPLAPSVRMLGMTPEDYDRCFQAILSLLDARTVLAELRVGLPPERPLALLCYESPGLKCHRRAVAEWLEQKLGIVVPEWGHEREGYLAYQEMPLKRKK